MTLENITATEFILIIWLASMLILAIGYAARQAGKALWRKWRQS